MITSVGEIVLPPLAGGHMQSDLLLEGDFACILKDPYQLLVWNWRSGLWGISMFGMDGRGNVSPGGFSLPLPLLLSSY